jgi:hypothetical protein
VDRRSRGRPALDHPDQPVNPQPVIDGLLVYDVAIRNAIIGFNCGEGPCHNMRLEALDVALPGAGEGSGADAVAVENGDHIVVFNAHITGAAADGLGLQGHPVAIANVIVHDVARNGIKLWHGGEVINALVYRTGADAALVLETGNTYRVVNSVFAYHAEGESAYAGTVAYDSPDEPGNLTVRNTVFYRNSGALWVSGAFALDVRASIFFGSANGQELIWATEPELALGKDEQPPEALDAAGGGHGLSFIDPGFADPAQGDFRPTAGAALIDRGESAAADLLPPFDCSASRASAGCGSTWGRTRPSRAASEKQNHLTAEDAENTEEEHEKSSCLSLRPLRLCGSIAFLQV